jgi:protein ImuB
MPDRWLAVHLPAFRLERCGFDAVEVVALIAEERSAMRLASLTPAAEDAGLRPGMSVSEARALVPGVRFELFDPTEEARDRGELLRALEALSDRVEVLDESSFAAEITRTAQALGGEAEVGRRAAELAEQCGHRASVVVADDPWAALALARSQREARRVVPAGALAAALTGLPPVALGASAALDGALAAIGIRALGAFAALDPASVAGRFGPEGVRLHRLARGEPSGTPDAALSWADADLPRVEAALAGATSTLQVHFALPGLLARLCELLADRDLAAVRLRASLALEQGNPRVFGVRVGRPTRDARTLDRLVRNRLEALGPLGAPVEALILEVAEAVPETGWQPGLTDRAESAEPLPDVLARLVDGLGPAAVFAAEPVEVWRPEAAWRRVPFPWAPKVRRPPPPSDDPVLLQERWECALRAARPCQLQVRPLPVDVREGPDGPVALLLDGTWLTVADRHGPESLSGEWWRPELAWERTYWVVRVEDRVAWIYASEHRWFLHGWF